MFKQQQSEIAAELARSAISFTRVSWVHVNDNDQALFVYSSKFELLHEPGGKLILDQKDEETLAQKVLRDLQVRLIPETIEWWFSFKAQADGMPDGVRMKTRCFKAQFEGILGPNARWLGTGGKHRTTESGSMFIQRLFYNGIVG